MIEVCGGFDGSENDDFTVIRLETVDFHQFTPTYGESGLPTIWNPSEWGGRIPRDQVDVAWDWLSRRFKFVRVYCDPGFHDETSWESDIERWASLYGEDVFVPWPTNQIGRMYPALRRFESDLRTGALTHDACKVTALHVGNARKIPKSGDRYILGKPSQHQKIDAAVTSVICHEAAADAKAAGWGQQAPAYAYVF